MNQTALVIPLAAGGVSPAMEHVMRKLESVYGVGRRWSEYELSCLWDIARQPTSVEECEMICGYYASLPHGSKMMPFSVIKTLERWTELLDRCRLKAPLKVTNPVKSELNAVKAKLLLMRSKFVDADNKWNQFARDEDKQEYKALVEKRKGFEG